MYLYVLHSLRTYEIFNVTYLYLNLLLGGPLGPVLYCNAKKISVPKLTYISFKEFQGDLPVQLISYLSVPIYHQELTQRGY